jgi:predicted nucleic acid-binding protein
VIFVDTGFLFALVSKRDAHHKRVVEVFREFQNRRLADRLLTTNHVVAEAITLCRGARPRTGVPLPATAL